MCTKAQACESNTLKYAFYVNYCRFTSKLLKTPYYRKFLMIKHNDFPFAEDRKAKGRRISAFARTTTVPQGTVKKRDGGWPR